MYHQPFYSQSQQPSFHNNHGPNHFFMPSHASSYHHGPTSNQSSHNIKHTRDFERFSMPPHGFSSMPTGAYPFYDVTNQQRWRQNMSRNQNQYRQTPAFHFQDKSTYYYMGDPILNNDNRITIQLTKVHIGPNGDQQRVFVEQEFSNDNQLKKFIKNLRENFEKTFNNRATGVHSSNENIDENQNTDNKKPGVIVVEEPDEEPIVYDQQAYNENIQSKIKSPTINEKEQNQQSSLILSCSTIRSNKRRKNKMKYRRQKFDNQTHQGQNEKSSNYYGPPPPRFQQRFFNKENHFRAKTDFNNQNSHWKFNGYSRSYMPPQSRFADQNKYQPSPRFSRGQQRNQPTTIAENLVFTNNKQQQTPVQRTRSDCRAKVPLRSLSKTHQYLDYGSNVNQQYFMPFNCPPRAPMKFFRDTQVQYRLFNPYRPNSNRF